MLGRWTSELQVLRSELRNRNDHVNDQSITKAYRSVALSLYLFYYNHECMTLRELEHVVVGLWRERAVWKQYQKD